MVVSLLLKLAWWILPKVAGFIVDKVAWVLSLVELAEQNVPDPAERRNSILAQLKESLPLPEAFLRILVEFCVILSRLGVSSGQVAAMEQLCTQEQIASLASAEKRAAVLEAFKGMYPEVPEKAARLMLELAVAKLKGVVTGA